MAIPPFNDLRLKKGEWPKQERLEELLEGYARNFEDLYNRAQTIEASNEAGNEFLRLLTKGKHKATWGEDKWTWPGGNIGSTVKVTNYGFTAGAAVILITPITTGVVGAYPMIATKEATKFSSQGFATTGAPALGVTASFYWIAIS
jgi:hypothetical protein